MNKKNIHHFFRPQITLALIVCSIVLVISVLLYTTYVGFRKEIPHTSALLTGNNPSSEFTIGNNYIEGLEPQDIVKDSAGKIFVADTGNNRVLIYNTEPTDAITPPSIVIGQSNTVFTSMGTSASTLSGPMSVATDDTHIVIADTGNHRILIYSSYPNSNGASSSYVIGQPDVTSNTANNGGVSNHSLFSPTSVAIRDGKLYVSDSGNNRVLIWNTLPLADNTPASVVVGQPDFVSNGINNGGLSAFTLAHPVDAQTDGTHLFITDQDNNRILIFNSIPTLNHPQAQVVLGQPDGTTATANNGGITANSLSNPIGARSDGTNLFVADGSNERVLLYTSIPTSNQASANVIIGQTNATSSTTNITSAVYTGISRPYSDGVHLYLADQKNHRILAFSSIPTSDGTAANKVLGQHDFVSNVLIDGSTIFSGTTYTSGLLSRVGKVFLYSPSFTNRVLMFDAFPVNDRSVASHVWGAADFFSKNSGGSYGASSLFSAERSHIAGLGSNNSQIAIADPDAHRVLFWNTLWNADNQAADFVLGQSDMNSGALQTTASDTLGEVGGISMGQCQMAIADTSSNRVLFYNLPIVQNKPASQIILGQPDMTSNTANNGGISSTSLNLPEGISIQLGKAFIADTQNNRVLVYNSIPTTSQQAADFVLGQANFTTATANNVALPANAQLHNPTSVTFDGSRIFVADHDNNRVLVWNTPITSNGQSATYVIGQPDFTTTGINTDDFTATPLPMTVSYAQGKLLVTTNTYARTFDVGSTGVDTPAEELSLGLSNYQISLQAHPSVNGGKSNPAHSTLTVQSNATNGYTIYASLRDIFGRNSLRSGIHNIPSGTGINSFGFEAFNSDYDAGHTISRDASFASDATALSSHSTTIGYAGATCGSKHTIYYDLSVDYLTSAGEYEGNIVYTAVGNF